MSAACIQGELTLISHWPNLDPGLPAITKRNESATQALAPNFGSNFVAFMSPKVFPLEKHASYFVSSHASPHLRIRRRNHTYREPTSRNFHG